MGTGAKVLGKLTIGAGATIGANAVATKNAPAGAVVIVANRIIKAPLCLVKIAFNFHVPVALDHEGMRITEKQTQAAIARKGLDTHPLRWWDDG